MVEEKEEEVATEMMIGGKACSLKKERLNLVPHRTLAQLGVGQGRHKNSTFDLLPAELQPRQLYSGTLFRNKAQSKAPDLCSDNHSQHMEQISTQNTPCQGERFLPSLCYEVLVF